MKLNDKDAMLVKNLFRRACRDAFIRSTVAKSTLARVRVEKPRYKKNGELYKVPSVFYRCNACKELHKANSVQIDHVKPLGRGVLSTYKEVLTFLHKLFESDNVQVLCKPCHKAKTAKERKKKIT